MEFVEKGNNVYFCGGLIIYLWWILIVGYCVDLYYSFVVKEIWFGEYDWVVLEGYEEVFDGDRFYIYLGFKYDWLSYVSLGDYDIVFYYLKWLVIFYSWVSLVCMFDEDLILFEDVGWVCVVIGWGYIVEYGNFFEVL